MRYIILGKNYNLRHPSYRGTYREMINYQDAFPEDHEVNKAFFRHIEESSKLRVLPDLEVAKKYVELFHRFVPEKHFEVVAVHTGPDPTQSGEFLGYDVSSRLHLSYLSEGLEICPDDGRVSGLSGIDVAPVLCLVERYFKPHLNVNGLFEDYEIASFLLRFVTSMDKLAPNLWDNPSTYEVIGLWKVYPD